MIDTRLPQSDSFRDRLQQAKPQLLQRLEQFRNAKILVVGDLTLDEFITGEVERISREAPVPIIRHETTRRVPGGGANAVYNLAKLGGQISVAGLVGDDEQGQALVRIFQESAIDTSGIFIDGDRPTVTKTRISAHARQSVTQQVLRLDRKSDALPNPDLQQQLAQYIQQQAQTVAAVVCSDYGDGVLTPGVIQRALTGKISVVDSQTQLSRYQNATLFTPNLPEAELEVGYAIDDDHSLKQAGNDLLERTQAEAILITRGGDGMTLFERSGIIEQIQAFNRTDVFDVTGAGDTVVAALTLALACGSSLWEAVVLGNLAASLVVRQFGTATTSIEEMKFALNALLQSDLD